LRLPVDGSLWDAPQAAAVYLPAIFMAADADTWLHAQAQSVSQVLPWLRHQSQRGAILGAVATSNLLLAEAGLLHKMRVPVPWIMEAFLHRRYPSIAPRPHQEMSHAGNIYCAGNLSSSLALAIELVDTRAPLITGLLNQYIHPMEVALEGPLSNSATKTSDPLVARAMVMIQMKHTQKIDYVKLARDLAVSQRTLIRHFNCELGLTPQAYQQQLRMEGAKRLLAETQLPIARIAEAMGYATPAYFCRLFRQRLGISVQAYQEQCRVERARASPRASKDPLPI
jgi:transcriptional regulator GlxA family with amidase domain